MQCRPSSRNEIAADEITAFAAGAGPPENTIPTRLMWSPLRLGAIAGAAYLAARQMRNARFDLRRCGPWWPLRRTHAGVRRFRSGDGAHGRSLSPARPDRPR